MDFQDDRTSAPSPPSEVEFVVVGAGLAGLAAALTLHRAGREVLILERDESVGGRVRTDLEDGYVLDRGFQVLLTAYPEVARHIDLDALDLRPFVRGVNVWDNGSFTELSDPRRSLTALVGGLRTQVLTTRDRVRFLKLAVRLLTSKHGFLGREDDCSTGEFLETLRFSDRSIEKLWEPLLSGIQLTPSLEGSARLACLILRCLLVGPAAVPARGMQEIPNQMAAGLPRGSVHVGVEVEKINGSEVFLSTGEVTAARRVIVATEQPAAARLLKGESFEGRAQWHAYFSAPEAPSKSEAIHLLPSVQGPCRNIAIMSNVAPEYAPQGSALIVAAGPTSGRESHLVEAREQLVHVFGHQAQSWELIKQGIVEHAQPMFVPGANFRRQIQSDQQIVVAGDHRTTPSIQGALVSGRLAALEAIREQ